MFIYSCLHVYVVDSFVVLLYVFMVSLLCSSFQYGFVKFVIYICLFLIYLAISLVLFLSSLLLSRSLSRSLLLFLCYLFPLLFLFLSISPVPDQS